MSDSAGLPWLDGLDKWRRQVLGELAALPDTLRSFRDAVENFQRITKRLLDATEGLEQFAQVTRLYTTGMAEGRKRLEEATRTLREQATAAGADPIRTAVEDVTKALSAVADLNPLWRWGGGTHGATGSD